MKRLPLHLLVLLCASAASAVTEPLTLRVQDAEGVPGGRTAIVVRTYASRPMSQGQIDLGSRRPGGSGVALLPEKAGTAVFTRVLGAQVWSDEGNALEAVDLFPDGELIELSFQSPSTTVNAADGPMLVVFVELAADLVPGQNLPLEIDGLLSEAVGTVPLRLRGGELTIRAPTAPISLSAEDAEGWPGSVAWTAVETAEPLAISRGEIVLTFDPALSTEAPLAEIDPRYGRGTVAVDREAGRVRVTVDSVDASLGEVPGAIVRVGLPLVEGAALGSHALGLDAAATWLEDAAGQRLHLALEGGTIDVVPAPASVFGDGFECGSVAAWSAVAGL